MHSEPDSPRLAKVRCLATSAVEGTGWAMAAPVSAPVNERPAAMESRIKLTRVMKNSPKSAGRLVCESWQQGGSQGQIACDFTTQAAGPVSARGAAGPTLIGVTPL